MPLPTLLQRTGRSASLALAAVVVAASLAGCGYSIKGRVVRGGMGYIQWVGGDGATGEPVEGAVVTITRDPQGLNPARAGQAVSAADGTFTLAVSGFGTGWMEELWLIQASRSGVGSAEWLDRLPASTSGQTLVVTLAKGAPGAAGMGYDRLWRGETGQGDSAESLMKEVDKYR